MLTFWKVVHQNQIVQNLLEKSNEDPVVDSGLTSVLDASEL